MESEKWAATVGSSPKRGSLQQWRLQIPSLPAVNSGAGADTMSRRGAECCACLVWTKGKNGEVFGGYLAEGEREGGMDGIWRAHNEKE
jgi:hypothetical protein